MRKRLQIAMMASTLAATSLSLTPQLRAADGDGTSEKITATDEHGRKIYVNDTAATSPARHTQEAQTPRRTLMYWSSKDNRWKPVPPPNAAAMPAAPSAAAEGDHKEGRD